MKYDVVIVGGGPAGCAAALALKRHGVSRVLLAEAGTYNAPRVGECLLPDARLHLERLGVWEDFRQQGHEPCLGSRSSWGSDEFGYNDFLFNPLGNGWHLDRLTFDARLALKAAEAGIVVLTGTKFTGFGRPDPAGLRLRFADADGVSRDVRSRFVVDATGKRSAVARRMGAKPLDFEKMVSICGFLEAPGATDRPRLTMIEAVEYGWWYAAWLPGGRMAASLTTDPNTARQRRLHEPAHWLEHFGGTRLSPREAEPVGLGRFLVCTTPSYCLDVTAGDSWLSVGDAASPFDPICAQGVRKALADGLDGADATTAWLGGDRRALEAYREGIQSRYLAYFDVRSYYYGQEKRWPESLFWEGRRSSRRSRIPRPDPATRKPRSMSRRDDSDAGASHNRV